MFTLFSSEKPRTSSETLDFFSNHYLSMIDDILSGVDGEYVLFLEHLRSDERFIFRASSELKWRRLMNEHGHDIALQDLIAIHPIRARMATMHASEIEGFAINDLAFAIAHEILAILGEEVGRRRNFDHAIHILSAVIIARSVYDDDSETLESFVSTALWESANAMGMGETSREEALKFFWLNNETADFVKAFELAIEAPLLNLPCDISEIKEAVMAEVEKLL